MTGIATKSKAQQAPGEQVEPYEAWLEALTAAVEETAVVERVSVNDDYQDDWSIPKPLTAPPVKYLSSVSATVRVHFRLPIWEIPPGYRLLYHDHYPLTMFGPGLENTRGEDATDAISEDERLLMLLVETELEAHGLTKCEEWREHLRKRARFMVSSWWVYSENGGLGVWCSFLIEMEAN